jgi:hypothetical protein
VVRKRSGALENFEKRLDVARVGEIGRALARHRFTAPRRSTLPRPPDDHPVTLALSRGGSTVFKVEIYSGDRHQDADLDALLDIGGSLIFELTGGRHGHVRGVKN